MIEELRQLKTWKMEYIYDWIELDDGEIESPYRTMFLCTDEPEFDGTHARHPDHKMYTKLGLPVPVAVTRLGDHMVYDFPCEGHADCLIRQKIAELENAEPDEECRASRTCPRIECEKNKNNQKKLVYALIPELQLVDPYYDPPVFDV